MKALAEFTMDGITYWNYFESSIGTTIGQLSRTHGKVRAYGEMVNVLWQKGMIRQALEVEGFWNQLSMKYPFCLFCAYALDHVDSSGVKSISHAHTRTCLL